MDQNETILSIQLFNKSDWISVNQLLPTRDCLAFYKNSYGKERIVRAFYAKKFEVEQQTDTEFYEYNEENDSYYLPEGWHECIDNWDEYSSVAICEGIVSHWMPMPKYPE